MLQGRSSIKVSYVLIEDEKSLCKAVAEIPSEGVIGLDTETFWDRSSNQNRLSLVQIAAQGPEVLVVDALSAGIEPLRQMLEAPAPRMVAHNARFDRGVLMGAGIQPGGLIDTLQLARAALTLPSYSLAAVTEHLFGFPLDKTLRTSNWRRRPLSPAQVSYAAADARIVLLVYEELKNRLEREGRFEAALRAASLGATYAPGKRRRTVKQELAPPLTRDEKRMVSRLKTWRLERANLQKVPAYMICPDRTLEHLVRARPETLEALEGIYGLGASKISCFGDELLKALREACEERA